MNFEEYATNHTKHPHCAACGGCLTDPRIKTLNISPPFWCVGCVKRIDTALPVGATRPWDEITRLWLAAEQPTPEFPKLPYSEDVSRSTVKAKKMLDEMVSGVVEKRIRLWIKKRERLLRRMLIDITKHGWGTWASYGWDEYVLEFTLAYKFLGEQPVWINDRSDVLATWVSFWEPPTMRQRIKSRRNEASDSKTKPDEKPEIGGA